MASPWRVQREEVLLLKRCHPFPRTEKVFLALQTRLLDQAAGEVPSEFQEV